MVIQGDIKVKGTQYPPINRCSLTDNDKVELGKNDQSLKNLRKDLDTLKKIASGQIEDLNPNIQTPYGEMPHPEELEAAFKEAEVITSLGHPDDCESVKKFEELFEKGIAKPGDIILISKPEKRELRSLSTLVPGNYSHAAVYLGKDEKGEHKSVDAWARPHALVRDIKWWPKSYNVWCILRVNNKDGSELTEEQRDKIANFAKSAEGCKYNFNWPVNKVKLPVSKESTKFYCSQLAWASYFYTLGLNLDANPGFHPKYAWGVAPQELHDSPYVSVLGEYEMQKTEQQ